MHPIYTAARVLLSWLGGTRALLRLGAVGVALGILLASAPVEAQVPAAAAAGETELPRSEAEKARGLPIARVDVAGNRRITKDDIISYLRSRVGSNFSPETLSQDVRELWQSG
ncbi:MAG: hypothetical protein KC492_39535, partial [Myxococcales bacterium]|nr:hypothetical protein [Myxococcales bacterium]